MLDQQNTQLPAPRVAVVSQDAEKFGYIMERPWYRFFSNFYNYFTSLPYGSFADTTTQTAAANTPTAIKINTTSVARHTYVGIPTSRIVFDADGLTSITFSLQLSNPSNTSEDDVYVWLRKNGVDVPYTSSAITVAKSHGGVDGTAILTVNFFETFAPGDYFELYWLTTTGASQIKTIAASTSPARPASPGVVLTVSQII